MLVRAMRRFWLLACVVFLATLCAVGVASAQLTTSSTVTAVVAVGPRAEAKPNPSAALITLLTTKYVAFASSDALAEQVASDLELPVADVEDGLEVTMPERTTSIRIAVTADDPTEAAAVAGAISEAVVERSASDVYLSAETVVPADAAGATERSGRPRLLLVGAAGALVLAVGAAVAAQSVAGVRVRQHEARAGTSAA